MCLIFQIRFHYVEISLFFLNENLISNALCQIKLNLIV